MKIVLFEDDPETGPRLLSEIAKHLPKNSSVELFEASAHSKFKDIKLYEERLAAEIELKRYRDATLWVTDRDLSRIEHYEGLSEAIISKVAFRFGKPLCKYARGLADDDVLTRQRSWGDAQIVLGSKDLRVLGERIAIVGRGFERISDELNKIMPHKKVIAGIRTPSDVMARLLGRVDLADQIALYGSGDQSMVVEILPFANTPAGVERLKARLPSLLGYWLYDSLLRFPGILVNATAAASYLDIAANQFEGKAVRNLFRAAIYTGPFADENDPHWWRTGLDEILGAAKASSGRRLASEKLKKQFRSCLDAQTRKRAGYYCMVKRVPVSEENSVGNISWFPPGADLSRVRKDVYDQMGPWLGLF
jgi:hypothetical protein